MKKNLKWIICSILMIIFLILCFLVMTRKDLYLDSSVYGFISKFIKDDLTLVVKYLTYIGSAIAVIGTVIFVFIFFKNKKYGMYMSINLILITIFQLILKNIFSRNRPIDINLIDETGYSFPSGHSLTSMAFYGFIIYLIYTSDIKGKKIFITLFSLLILVTGLSRIYLGVHYFTDVVGGFVFAAAYLIVYTHMIKDKIRS